MGSSFKIQAIENRDKIAMVSTSHFADEFVYVSQRVFQFGQYGKNKKKETKSKHLHDNIRSGLPIELLTGQGLTWVSRGLYCEIRISSKFLIVRKMPRTL